jgi:uncharacterized protein (DUF952 family)
LIIYHITSREAWLEAGRRGAYSAESLQSEGFIHCSTRAQVLQVARRFYPGRRGLVLLVIDPAKLIAEVKWELSIPPEGMAPGSRFPHVYGEIGLEAVVQCLDFEPNRAGDFELPLLPPEEDRAGPV